MKTNIIDYWIIKYRRAAPSVLGSKTFEQFDASDVAIIINYYLNAIIQKTLKITALTNCATLFNSLIRNAPPTKKWIRVDLKAEGEAYNSCIVNCIYA